MQYILGLFGFVFSRFTGRPPFGIAVTAISVIVLVIIALDFLSKLLRCTVSVNATIIKLIPRDSNSDGRIFLFAPEYSYAYNNEQYTRRSETYSGGKQYEIGTIVKVRIDPRHPETFIDLKREFTRKSVLIAVSVLALIIGIIILR